MSNSYPSCHRFWFWLPWWGLYPTTCCQEPEWFPWIGKDVLKRRIRCIYLELNSLKFFDFSVMSFRLLFWRGPPISWNIVPPGSLAAMWMWWAPSAEMHAPEAWSIGSNRRPVGRMEHRVESVKEVNCLVSKVWFDHKLWVRSYKSYCILLSYCQWKWNLWFYTVFKELLANNRTLRWFFQVSFSKGNDIAFTISCRTLPMFPKENGPEKRFLHQAQHVEGYPPGDIRGHVPLRPARMGQCSWQMAKVSDWPSKGCQASRCQQGACIVTRFAFIEKK